MGEIKFPSHEIIGTIFSVITLLFYIPIIVFIIFAKPTHNIIQRSPILISITLLSSFFTTFITGLVYFLNFNLEHQANKPICSFYQFSCNCLHFSTIIPYILRTFRIINIFDIENVLTRTKLKERYYIFLFLAFFTLLLTNYFLLTFLSLPQLLPIDIPVCSEGTYNSFDSYSSATIHLIEFLIIVYLIYSLRKIRDEFNFSNELKLLGVIWCSFELLFLSLWVFNVYIDQSYILALNISKGYLLCIITGIIPLFKSENTFYLPICSTRECSTNFNLMLMNEKSFNAFFEFIQKNYSEDIKYLNFWIDANLVKYSYRNYHKRRVLTPELYEKYMKEGSKFNIQFPSETLRTFQLSYMNLEKTDSSSNIEVLLDFIYNYLESNYFKKFLHSKEFIELQSALEKEERIYSRLVQAEIISNE